MTKKSGVLTLRSTALDVEHSFWAASALEGSAFDGSRGFTPFKRASFLMRTSRSCCSRLWVSDCTPKKLHQPLLTLDRNCNACTACVGFT